MSVDELLDCLETNHCKPNAGCNALDVCACSRLDLAAERIRAQRELLEECEKLFAEFAKAGGAGYAFRSREMLAKLRKEQADE